MITYRIISIIGLLVAIVFLPYWIYVPALAIAVIVLPFFWEGIIFGLLIDALYGSSITSFYSVFKTFSFWTLALLIIILPVRKRLRAYA